METYQDSSERLRTEILAEAGKKGEEIVIRANQEAEVLLARAEEEANHVREEILHKANGEAERRSALIMATVPVEVGKLRAARIEELLDAIHEEANKRFVAREGFDYTKAIIALASHAIRQMAGDVFVIKLSDTDRTALGEDFVEEVANGVGRPVRITVSFEENVFGGGVVIEDEEVHQMWDNRLLRRLERMWPEMRRYIAKQMTLVSETGTKGDDP